VIVVDTNILVHAANTKSPFHDPCRNWLEVRRSRPDAWYTTWPILYEFLRVVTHPRVMASPWPAPTAWKFVVGLLSAPGLAVLVATQRHADIVSALIGEHPSLAGNIWHDAHTVALMREHGIKQICTRDTDFHRFPLIEVIDPARIAS
jgi:toxin-antitoxin system PIN domain toxin